MQLTDRLDAADLTLSFVTQDSALPERLTRGLKPGEVRLTRRGENGDEALALFPTAAAEARDLGAALSKLAGELRASGVRVPATEHAAPLAAAALAAAWQDRRYKGEPKDMSAPEVHLAVEGLAAEDAARVRALAAGVEFARELVSAPANVLNPVTLAREARSLERLGLDVDVWDGDDIAARGMGLLVAVAAGSATGPRLIRVTLPARGSSEQGKAEHVIALVGKGITFDTGGYSLKPAAGMYGMKNDMGGAGAVLGAMRALGELRAHIPEGVEVRAYVAAAENMVGPDAMRPGDIFRAANGLSVEVTNTDAEGRLVLGDTLTVACDEGATEVVDLATLTGAKVTALGSDIAALFSSDAALTARIQAGAEAAGEFVWELPLHQPYLKAFQKATLADLKNSDLVPAGGSIKAALFLQQFVTRPWAHIDIAGNAIQGEAATGWGVGTLVEYVLARR
ncbi:leucyl aminopeptidase family protein [Deinococcus sp. Leaf326]|uniref:M17 family metallopeptidase n=1 Tax=Deinococcus sp. Leaf326 TaxID=1736338 RepID=UPI0006F95D77|nr:leucyl aminopeptidase family protein [Deinococcus sp. Leaf326]KQR08893.1 leucyl aminopeptidase [Deinococcus sp. Leaf326]